MAGEDRIYVGFVKGLRCLMTGYSCDGVTEAHHAGERGLSQRAHDWTCVPLCMLHHRQWNGASGTFRDWKKNKRRERAADWIGQTQARWRASFPDAAGP